MVTVYQFSLQISSRDFIYLFTFQTGVLLLLLDDVIFDMNQGYLCLWS